MQWLVKEEPEHYSFAQFAADGSTVWSGVRNPVAQKNLRGMKKGDRVFFYHTGKQRAIVGTAVVGSAPRPDPKDKTGKLFVVDLTAGEPLGRPVTLAEIKADSRFASFALVRISRLSVMPVSDVEWKAIVAMSQR